MRLGLHYATTKDTETSKRSYHEKKSRLQKLLSGRTDILTEWNDDIHVLRSHDQAFKITKNPNYKNHHLLYHKYFCLNNQIILGSDFNVDEDTDKFLPYSVTTATGE